MAAPTPYSLAYDFTSFQTANPTTPLPADKVEIEYNAISTTTGEIITNLGLIQQSDGTLVNGIVDEDALSSGILATLGAGTGEITTLAGLSSEITALDAISNDITIVAEIPAAVTTVSGISGNVTTVAGDSAAIATANANSANINTVAGISANVTTVAGVSADVTTVAADLSGTDTIGTVAGIAANVTTVAGVSADVTTVAGVSADVTTVAADLSGTDTIGTVATNIADVTAVGGSITDVNTAATNIAAIIAAPTEASNAASSASAASTSETNAAASAAKLVGTSVTSITIGTGSKVFTTQSGKQFNVGQYVLIVSDADPTVDFMAGQITAYSGTSLTVDVTSTGGSGAHTDWTIYIAGPVGATGERGATWQGAWATSTAYSVDDVVENEGSSYICILGHTSGASTEPGVGASWETNWELLAQAASPDASIQFVIDGGGSEIVTGVKGYMEVPFACTIQEVRLLADQSGSIVIDIWKDTYANYPPTNADSITASAVPTITSSTKSEDATLTGWTTSLAKGDVLGFNVDSVTTITRVTVVLEVLK